MKVQHLVKGLPLFAQILISDARLKGVRVVTTGDHTASTDGQTIRLPGTFLVPSADMDECDEAQWRDYAHTTITLTTHEVGHVIHTDFSVSADIDPDSRRMHILNLLEDPRVDEKMVGERPGLDEMYQTLGERLVREGFDCAVTPDAQPNDALMGWLHHHARNAVRNEPVYAALAETARPIVEGHFGAQFADAVDMLIAESTYARSTGDLLSLTDRLLAFFEEAAKPPEPPPEQGDGEGGGQGEGDGENAEPQTNAAGLDAAQAKALAEALAQSSTDVAEQRLAAVREAHAAAEEAETKKGATGMPIDPDAVGSDAGGDIDTDGLTFSDAVIDISKVNAVTGVAKMRLRNLLNAQALDDTEIRDRGSRLSQKHAHRIATGDSRVWKHRIECESVNTAVFLLVDVSTSMKGNNIVVAREAAYATAMSLRGFLGITLAVGAFPGNGLVMPFGGSPSTHGDRFRFDADGGTPMAEGLMFAGRQLARRDEHRKLVIVITDGKPDDQQRALQACTMLHHMSIETIGIGIGTDSVKNLFPVSEVLRNIGGLPNALFATLRQQLVTQRRVA